jgi:hypothetical protein
MSRVIGQRAASRPWCAVGAAPDVLKCRREHRRDVAEQDAHCRSDSMIRALRAPQDVASREVLRAAVEPRLPIVALLQMLSTAEAMPDKIVELGEKGSRRGRIFDRLCLEDSTFRRATGGARAAGCEFLVGEGSFASMTRIANVRLE